MTTKLTALKNHAGFIRYFKNTRWMDWLQSFVHKGTLKCDLNTTNGKR